MKYAIKRFSRYGVQYVSKITYGGFETAARTLSGAMTFDSLESVMGAIVDRTCRYPNPLYGRFTIVGVREVSEPRLEEVAL